jgi:hypothetical protein
MYEITFTFKNIDTGEENEFDFENYQVKPSIGDFLTFANELENGDICIITGIVTTVQIRYLNSEFDVILVDFEGKKLLR